MSVKRINADVKEIQKELYSDMGIYYTVDDESNIGHGTACIFGPSGTPYEDCPMLFEFNISSEFPFEPPQVFFRTYDGLTRFHPNMYRDGKVCLSILHTWDGPRWASTMRLSSILVTLQSLMDSAPIRHEPGYSSGRDELSNGYSKFVEIACIRYSLDRLESYLQKKTQPREFVYFLEVFLKRLPGMLERFESRLKVLYEGGEIHFTNLPYQLQGRSGYKNLLERVVKLKVLYLSSIE
jgi:ubiquitin-protein ligase